MSTLYLFIERPKVNPNVLKLSVVLKFAIETSECRLAHKNFKKPDTVRVGGIFIQQKDPYIQVQVGTAGAAVSRVQ